MEGTTPATGIRRIEPIEFSTMKALLMVPFLTILTGGLILLLMTWYDKLWKFMLYNSVHLDTATHLFVEGLDSSYQFCPLKRQG